MEHIRSKYRAYLERLLSGRDPADPHATEKAFTTLREAHERLMEKNPHFIENGREREFREAMEAVIQEHAIPPQPEITRPDNDTSESGAPQNGGYKGLFTGFAAGALLVAIVAFLLVTFNVIAISTGDAAERAALFEQDFQRSVGQLETVAPFLKEVEAEILRRQKEDAVSLNELAGKKFVSLATFDKALNAKVPKPLPPGTAFIVRATDKAYKVVATGPLCRTAVMKLPDLVDPQRKRHGLNCARIGYWNKAGSKF